MKIFKHRINTIAELALTSKDFGGRIRFKNKWEKFEFTL
jgi:hypothetical protein